jgi:type IV secretion system protein VirB6
MACPQVATGSEFLVRTLAHLDCQAQTIGSFGFQSLAERSSLAGAVLSALLALFIALYAIRMLFGPSDEPRDLIGAVLKMGIVLTMAISWPAWRTVAYDTVLYGPAEVAAAITPATLPDPRAEFPERLQNIDAGIALLTVTGTGTEADRLADDTPGGGFASVALDNGTALGWARSLYLAATIGSLATLRIAGGLLLALAPLFAGLLLFDLTRGIFSGWLRGLALVALGSLGLTVLLSVQIAVTEPWLADVLERRSLRIATPTAATELLALVMAFAIAIGGLMYLLGKITFQQVMTTSRPVLAKVAAERRLEPVLSLRGEPARIPVHSRAVAVSESVEAAVRRESSRETIDRARLIGTLAAPAAQGPAARPGGSGEPLGSGYRRAASRNARSQRARDDRR